MILIADSGSTSTQWCLIEKNLTVQTFETEGINPFYQTTNDISQSIASNPDLLSLSNIEALYFYGAGCINDDKNRVVLDALKKHFQTIKIEIHSDLLAAARATCGHKEGIACILGTGSNSCRYNGSEIIENVSPLGFILGDEGSGAVLGKRLVGDILKKQLPQEIIDAFNSTYNLSAAEILHNVYKQPFPNRYLAKFSLFLNNQSSHPAIENLISSEFQLFITRNLLGYSDIHQLPIHFTGSIAHHFSDVLKRYLTFFNLKCGKIEASPIGGLIDFHTKK